jgi:hypothetical protein
MNNCPKPKKLPKNVGKSSKSRNKMPIKYSIEGKEKTSNSDQVANAMEEQLNEDASKESVDFF